jgi:N-acetylmuramoyl-L-alanine amidase
MASCVKSRNHTGSEFHVFRAAARSLVLSFVAVFLTAVLSVAASIAQTRPSPRAVAVQTGPVVTQISLQQEPESTSLVIDMSSEVRAQISAMLDPQRLLLDFQGVRFHAPSIKVTERDGLVRDLRFGAFMRGQGRVVLDLGRPAHVSEQRFMPLQGGGTRLVITGNADKGRTDPAELQLVVLDPGHGGIDTGASGPAGELEKTIVLQFSLALKERIETGGKARVLMTRSTDVFIPLRDRVRMARQAKAALFISLHADALADEADVRGGSVYILSERATDERSARLADKENRADLAAGIELKDDQDEVADILFDLARRESRAFSSQFARQLVSTLPRATRMHRNALRGAAFRVLRAPDVPSVLLELGYLTTAEDAKLMQTEEWRRATADAAAEAIERVLAEKITKDREKP